MLFTFNHHTNARWTPSPMEIRPRACLKRLVKKSLTLQKTILLFSLICSHLFPGIEVPIFIQFNGYQPHLDPSYQGRLRLVEQASVEVSDIRISDEGWYECTIVFLHGDQEQNSNGTWVYLSVNCEYTFALSRFLFFACLIIIKYWGPFLTIYIYI